MKITINVPDDDQGVRVVDSIAKHSGVIAELDEHGLAIVIPATVTTIELGDK